MKSSGKGGVGGEDEGAGMVGGGKTTCVFVAGSMTTCVVGRDRHTTARLSGGAEQAREEKKATRKHQ